jgi:hypothetical protein
MIALSYGGGKQTVALITLALQGRLAVPDLLVMADTGREVRTTFEYLESVVQPALAKIGRHVDVVSHSYATVDLWRGDDLLLPGFTRKGGRLGKLPTYCSNEWKQRVIRRWLRDQGVKDVDMWIGISLDEVERIKPSGLDWYRHVYPLIDMVSMHRSGCVNQIVRYGWPVPEKSRCWMCPNQSIIEWRRLHQRADGDFNKALKLEDEIHRRDGDVYLHPLGISLDEAIVSSERQSSMFDGCDGGYCMV